MDSIPSGSISMVYTDPPFNTGKQRTRRTLEAKRTGDGSGHLGFSGARYRTRLLETISFSDAFDDFGAFLIPRLEELFRVLSPDGSLFVHLDPREAHYCKIWLDQIFGREQFMNEIIWAYDYGGRSKKRWSTKHDTILWYVKDPGRYTYNYDQIDRIPYMAPALVTPEKAKKGKTPTDTWWNTIVPTNSREKTGYPTQKPLAIVDRIVRVHSNPGDWLLDPFAGSGTLGVSAACHGRQFTLVDNHQPAIETMKSRLADVNPTIRSAGMRPLRARDRGKLQKSERLGIPNAGLVSVISVTVSRYKNLKTLSGPKRDASAMKSMFSDDPSLALYRDSSTFLHDPTVERLRQVIVDFTMSRSSRGDVLIFYFSGHGELIRGSGSEFGFCAVDTETDANQEGALALTVVNFRDILRTLAAVDVHPVFIIDACFSGATITEQMHDSLERHAGRSYALLCSSYAATSSLDTPLGGVFTQALKGIVDEGRDGSEGKRLPFLSLADIAASIQEELARAGHPLSRCHIGEDLPEVPLVRNVAYEPLRYSFSGYMRDLIDYLWDGGSPREILISDIAKLVGNGAYGNHRKLSYAPWVLVEDGHTTGTRRLTKRGIDYVQGKLPIPQSIERDPLSGEWKPVEGTRQLHR